MKKILYTAFYFCSALLLSSCIGDLDQYPHEDETSSRSTQVPITIKPF